MNFSKMTLLKDGIFILTNVFRSNDKIYDINQQKNQVKLIEETFLKKSAHLHLCQNEKLRNYG